MTPFLFLSGLDDEQSRIEGFHVGADVYITKPFRVDEVVAQIDALVQMATRLRARRDSMLSIPPGAQATAIEGDLGQMSIATVLTVLEMERRTGTFEVISKKRRAFLDIVSGNVMEGTVGGTKVSALAALRTMLGWHVGRFSFVPSALKEVPSLGGNKTLGAFLIEALRLEDEATRAELELPPLPPPLQRDQDRAPRGRARARRPGFVPRRLRAPVHAHPPAPRSCRCCSTPSWPSGRSPSRSAPTRTAPARCASRRARVTGPSPRRRSWLPSPPPPVKPVIEQTPPAGRAVVIPPAPRVNVPPPRPPRPAPTPGFDGGPRPPPPGPQVEKKRG